MKSEKVDLSKLDVHDYIIMEKCKYNSHNYNHLLIHDNIKVYRVSFSYKSSPAFVYTAITEEFINDSACDLDKHLRECCVDALVFHLTEGKES